ncbi:MAG: peptidoglycan DD-metalloendopeptidase family protein [Pseudotabrizicola sp.]|uniref:peptidoglycan DD-metalloendopeptidase family protein n=1 Tax=Pseudotabrizicola sp. TaxID=2939647 RepID=UPI00271E77A9|nr:peptidoglycan DD-metalloendopeptidase family protein [Pseudotabrizicola sp.]MDO8881818.1 peptidoglycan DD-metalloendopeptidase family protein [Pseudotabrizicola sp.]MDP2082146.1 peptidoglycan DD-metalloendopeptidase family protein [Pseudotabrizicola sp.]MDZ7576539.1 peptidoglycan DD-metalloendopeptidase family protein [Pseudotabrizicola sp.]
MHPIPDQPDLYAALRRSGAAPEDLPTLIAASPPHVATRLRAADQGLLRAILRAGLGQPAIPSAPRIITHLRALTPEPLFRPDVANSRTLALLTNDEHPDMPPFSDRNFDAWFAAKDVPYGIGTYGEDRSVYRTAQFADAISPERRTRHLGIDVFAPAGSPVHAPLAGRVLHLTYNADPLDYGHTLIVEHQSDCAPFYTLYGHLAATLPSLLQPGAQVAAGQHIADLGDWPENGGWAPHVHFQIMTDMLDQANGNFYGVGHSSLWDVWQAICPDPNLIMRLPATAFTLP